MLRSSFSSLSRTGVLRLFGLLWWGPVLPRLVGVVAGRLFVDIFGAALEGAAPGGDSGWNEEGHPNHAWTNS